MKKGIGTRTETKYAINAVISSRATKNIRKISELYIVRLTKNFLKKICFFLKKSVDSYNHFMV